MDTTPIDIKLPFKMVVMHRCKCGKNNVKGKLNKKGDKVYLEGHNGSLVKVCSDCMMASVSKKEKLKIKQGNQKIIFDALRREKIGINEGNLIKGKDLNKHKYKESPVTEESVL